MPGMELDALVGMRLFVLLVTAAALVAIVAKRTAIPYTVALVVLGLGATFVAPEAEVIVTPDLVLAVLLPGLVFEAAYNIDFATLRRSFGGVALLAAPGVIVSAAVVAVVLAVDTGLPIGLGFVVGAMVAATDPAAVISTFRQLGAPRGLSTLVEGESLFNDGTGLVVFAIAIRAVGGGVTPVDAVVSFVLTVVISAAIGAIVGFLVSRVIATIDDHLIELTLSVAAAYGTYLLADAWHESGIIATVVAGVVIGNYGRQIGMSERTQEVLDVVWEFLAFLLTAVVFLLVGLAISLPNLIGSIPSIAWGVIAVLAGRALVVYVLLGGAAHLTRLGGRNQGMPLSWLNVLFWAGLRGAVAVAMALSLPLAFPQRELLQEITFGIVLFTLLVQGTTVGLVVARTVDDPVPSRSAG